MRNDRSGEFVYLSFFVLLKLYVYVANYFGQEIVTLMKDTIFSNVALTPDGGVWWEGMGEKPQNATGMPVFYVLKFVPLVCSKICMQKESKCK